MLPALAAGANVLGGVLSAIGQIQQGNEAVRNAGVQTQLMQRNLEIARVDTQQKIRDLTRQFQMVMGRQVATAGKSGVVAGSGSSLLAQIETRREARLATLRAEFQLDVQEAFTPFQVAQVERAAHIDQQNSVLSAFGSLFGSVGRAASNFQPSSNFTPQYDVPLGPVR